MSTSQPAAWSQTQLARLEAFQVERCVDIHCHLLPGLDDGPPTLESSMQLAQALVEDGITTVMATPHQLGRYDRMNSAELIRAEIQELSSALASAGIPLEILPGGDVRIDERLPHLLDEGEIGTLADKGRHLLLELPHDFLIDPLPTIELLDARGIQSIITHPERYRYLAGKEPMLQSWVQAGAVIQLTAGSLLGDFGRRAHAQAWAIVQANLASLIATDAHDTQHRPPRLSAALAALTEQLGSETASQLCLANPLQVYQGTTIASPLRNDS
ncbi:tyrosine-protein phosphatase [Bythopirellula polymerisocia]|uniref:protein-tyrosine-phosphatase n=1 Tax=Bythopirellula polymerisocia TaxID=2528003 RepID=A0A5C6CQI9_9BACT|nr:CpsB/CapC family capsule biosynthesis tyrosine phosphatase [Bythopirellula polymerisocia]TWU25784.1 Tyrosine-protein phosphatase YwqE [Bythopirellula polymerisocia]